MSAEESRLTETTTAAEVARWSDQTLQRLTQARLIGLLAVASGLVMFVIGEARSTLTHNLLSSGGLSLFLIGGAVFVAAFHTRDLVPDRSFAPAAITNPRMWFVLIWGAGIALSVILTALDMADLVTQLIMLALSLGLMIAGSVWAVRWLSSQRAKAWPINSGLRLRWVPAWTVLWAGVWGTISTFLAIVLEAAPVLMLALLTGTAFDEVPQTRLSSFEGLERAMRNPALLAAIFVGAVIAAPLIEEAVKAVGLRGLRRWIQRPADGWLLGFATGLGFGLLEGAFNLDNTENWFLGSWMRLAALLLHGLATSLTGLGYARYLDTQRRGEMWRGYVRAATMHGLWNASALIIAFTSFSLSERAYALNIAYVCGVGVLIVGAVVLMVLLLRRVTTAGVQTSIQEDHQQAQVPLPGGWSPMKFNLGWRLVGRQPIFVPAAPPDVPLGSSSANPTDEAYHRRIEEDLKSN